jgi:hypothetical protein
MVIKSRQTHTDKINTGSHSSLLDVASLDPKRSLRKNKENVCTFHLVMIERKVYTALVKVGQHSLAWGLKNTFLFSKALAAKEC